MFYNLRIFKTKYDAICFAEQSGYTYDRSHEHKNETAKCGCGGETEVACFGINDQELFFGICEGCGEEYN